MKTRFHATIAALCIAIALVLPTAAAQSVDGIVAVVGDDVILASELMDAVSQARASLGARADSMPPNVLRSNVLDQIILTKLQLDRARQLDLKVSDDDIAQGMARLARQTNMSTQQYVQALRNSGISPTAAQQRLRTDILIQKVRKAEVLDQIVVTDQDVTQFLESRSLRDSGNREYRIRSIRLDVPAAASSETVQAIRDKIEKLRARVVSGQASFADVAKAQSDGDSAARGGDMGWIGDAFMPQAFTDILPTLAIGEVSDVFRGNGALHLIKLLDERGSQNLAGGDTVMVKEVKVRHIVLTPNALRNSQRTRELAMELLERLAAGAQFTDLAKQYSDDKASASDGGSLGWIQAGMLGPREAVQIAQMQPNDVSPVLQTEHGYVIVQLLDRRKVDKTRDAIRRRARQLIGQRKAQEKGQLWLHKLRGNAYVDIRLPGYQPVGS